MEKIEKKEGVRFMKRLLSLVLVATMLLAVLAGCGGTSAPAASSATPASGASGQSGEAEWVWDRKVELVNPWSAGGGADTMIRAFAPYLQEELGTTVEVYMATGGSGAVGVDYISKQPADGYTYILATNTMSMNELQGSLPGWRDNYTPVHMIVNSVNTIFASTVAAEGKFDDWDSCIEYIKANPQEVTIGMTTITGSEAAGVYVTMAAALGCEISEVDNYIKLVTFGGTGEKNTALVGGHIYLAAGGMSETIGLVESGDLKVLIHEAAEPLKAYPNDLCTGQKGYTDATIGTWRGLFCLNGTPQAAIDSFIAAADRAWHSEGYQKWLEENSYTDRNGWLAGADFKKWVDDEYPVYENYLKSLGVIS